MKSLNPYCSGQWSRTLRILMAHSGCYMSLNPYCSGQWSRTKYTDINGIRITVLILIVVDNGLVLMIMMFLIVLIECLNPYCSGQWSRT